MATTSRSGTVVRDVPPIIDVVAGDNVKASSVDDAINDNDVEEVQYKASFALGNPRSNCDHKKGEEFKNGNKVDPSIVQ